MVLKPKIAVRAIADIFPYEDNAKIHDEGQVAKIAESIRQFGWDQPIVVDKDGVIIKGHGRRLAALHLGLTEVPVWVRDDLTDEQVRAARLADNRVAISNIDADLLQKELAALDLDMAGIFDKKELQFLEADLGELNEAAFVDDLDAEIEAQNVATAETIAATAEKQVPIAKALGFKSIKGSDERLVAILMAHLEAETGLTGAEAFIQFARHFASPAAQGAAA
ncbi:ParB/Srx family N-terminal domain-containing protein [Herbaspirillum huttiense]|uniref:ParB/Srx family N-terminal domain-containing protein n=1 Tax=Herbaspirillum huttiense subsp. lycopersici TaxID=3074428 RepID=A0ABU2EFX0_9BURK|nr:ParB/Srx family N-terminal domain-containing protein [Herbaspirillum huttiense]MDR9847035.1 ParB/Srx family N-terminal domain-containing protein [Herbaspirillum huttiense SE1]